MSEERPPDAPTPPPGGKPERKAYPLRLSAAMLSAIERWAQDEFRSTNGQIEALLHEALKKAGRI